MFVPQVSTTTQKQNNPLERYNMMMQIETTDELIEQS